MSSRIEFRLRQATPALVGWYEPELIDKTFFLRPSSIKGIWRWFARALIAGALYDQSYLCGKSRGGLYKIKEEEVRAISYLVGKVMGLGYVDPLGRESEISRFRLKVSILQRPRIDTIRTHGIIYYRGRRMKLQRLALLSLGRVKNLQYFEGGEFSLTLDLRRSLDKEGEELALHALILALTLSGIGKGSRRGLGSLDIVDIYDFTVEHDLKKFLNRTYEKAQMLVERYSSNLGLKCCSKPPELPPISVFTKRKSTSGMFISSVYKLGEIDWVKVHNFFLRGERCRVLYSRPQAQDILRQNLEAWILGLPREQKGTGYKLAETERRASPILMASHTHYHIFGRGVYITTFVSSDWPFKILWRGAGPPKSASISINMNIIVNAMRNALNEFWRYLGRTPRPVWPEEGVR
ncbi:MAG: type III-B CRISPR module RAMP protein Cmr1 [Thermoprotei archaeon]|nr:MAG: type III-B CRISPR module RAMP protein Cmr1 [Thermoprotei archaeon]